MPTTMLGLVARCGKRHKPAVSRHALRTLCTAGSVTRAVAKKITISNTDSKGVRFTLGHEATLAQPYPEEV
jgi:hypothetical protein